MQKFQHTVHFFLAAKVNIVFMLKILMFLIGRKTAFRGNFN